MNYEVQEEISMDNDVTRRTFLAALSASAAGVLTGGLPKILAAVAQARDSTFQLGGDLLVNRLGFGAMRLTGEGICHRAKCGRHRRNPLPAARC